jgi:hydroxymethylbilane synthase
VECRENDEELREWLQKLNDVHTERAVLAERAFLRQMEGGCQVPVAGYAYIDDREDIVLTALVASPDGKEVYKETVSGSNPEEVGTIAAKMLIERGAKALIDRIKEEMNRQ